MTYPDTAPISKKISKGHQEVGYGRRPFKRIARGADIRHKMDIAVETA